MFPTSQGFTTLLEEAQRGRAEANFVPWSGVYEGLGAPGRAKIDRRHQQLLAVSLAILCQSPPHPVPNLAILPEVIRG
jgi:hypothetical protein